MAADTVLVWASGVLALFFLTHAFVGHMLELSLRRTFLEEYRLHQDGKNITALQKQSTQLLTVSFGDLLGVVLSLVGTSLSRRDSP